MEMSSSDGFNGREWLFANTQAAVQSGGDAAEPHFWTIPHAAEQIRRRCISSQHPPKFSYLGIRWKSTVVYTTAH